MILLYDASLMHLSKKESLNWRVFKGRLPSRFPTATPQKSRPATRNFSSTLLHFAFVRVTKGRKEERRPPGNKKLNSCVRSAAREGHGTKGGSGTIRTAWFHPPGLCRSAWVVFLSAIAYRHSTECRAISSTSGIVRLSCINPKSTW